MAENETPKPITPKNLPKDGQVIMAIMKEMGITEYEPKTIIQLTEFVYRYGTSILEESRVFANNSKKRFIDLDDVRLALKLQNENTFTMPPPREVLLESARNKNDIPLPNIKPPCGLRLPPDRQCLSSPNYVLKSAHKKSMKHSLTANKPTVNIIKRTGSFGMSKQTVTIPKAVTKITNNTNMQQKTVLKPRIQIQSANNGTTGVALDNLKRKRDEGHDI